MLAVTLLAGCEVPTGVLIPSIPGTGGGPTGTVMPGGPTTPVTGSLADRQAAVRPIVERHAAEQGIPASLVMAVIQQESGFQPKVVSGAGAQGLMQLMPGTVDDINARAPKIHVSDPFDPDQNVAGGCWYLAWVHGQVPTDEVAAGDDWKFALAGYNGGIGRVQGAISQTRDGDPSHARVAFDDVADLLPSETRRYVPAVVAHWQTFGNVASSR